MFVLLLTPTELIVTSGGERVWPRPIEEKIKALIPYLGNVAIIGHNKDFLTCLLTIKVHFCPSKLFHLNIVYASFEKRKRTVYSCS